MRLKRGYNGGLYVVFADSHKAEKWEWLFGKLLGLQYASFGAFQNAFCVLDRELSRYSRSKPSLSGAIIAVLALTIGAIEIIKVVW